MKPISASPSKTECEVTKVRLTERADETEDLATGLIHKADKVKADEVIAAERNAGIKEQTETAWVTPAENIGVLQERPGTEFVDRSNQAHPEAEESDIKDPVPEPVPLKEPVDEAVPEAAPVEETSPRSAQDREATSQATPVRGPAHVAEAVPGRETPELLTDEEAESRPVYEERNVIGAASEEEDYQSLKYTPGKLRTSQLEKMMTKEEQEEEQRVQREQLAAIFQLLKDNQDTFGDVTEGDVEEQLKLYSI
ncbi:hypothetical protein SKAU_G00124820 [Synaphobranchus kaupii]|uniref:Matrix-remodeling-associated protein 7 helical domain-containing protein n=1 Tax=Synaphobranchus kaupii TaxID=118154 RepID=A0A9Q1J2E0_SYNKA|nr:hypothetical protein SKAU_G00124820 [Synaphobranchus kaupii]